MILVITISKPDGTLKSLSLGYRMANQVMDNRKFFILPQGYEGGGYYSYGTPDDGESQYAHPEMISLIQQVAFQWVGIDTRKFGVGNISLADGVVHPDHQTHRSGLEVDIRPIRVDGRRMPCTYREHAYDRTATAALIDLFRRFGDVRVVLFNDVQISGVESARGHDNHFHVALR